MYSPKQINIPTSRDTQNVFKGYNHTYACGSGEWYDTKNLTTEDFPVMSTRAPRKPIAKLNKPLGLTVKDSLIYADGTKLYINGLEISHITLDPTTRKQLVGMGAYLVIFPDKVYINTVDYEDHGYLENRFTKTASAEMPVQYTPCTIDGSEINAVVSSTKPNSPANGDYWVDTSSDKHELKQWASTSEMWVSVPTAYTKISMQGIGVGFKEYDGVTFKGFTSDADETKSQAEALNATSIVYAVSEDYVVVVGLIDKVSLQTSGTVTAERRVPDMDFVIESENRLWGCKYGFLAESGETVNLIYACKLGDFKNWNSFLGISTDSYYANLGSDGAFTGAVTYLGKPTFFKENVIHKVYGTFPSNYTISTTDCPGKGVQKGSGESFAIVNGVLFYKAPSSVCAYTGDYPQSVSNALGDEQYVNAIGSVSGDRYYISMVDKKGNRQLFVYDSRGMWMKEDDIDVDFMTADGSDLYLLCSDGQMYLNGAGNDADENVVWKAQTGNIGFSSPDSKYVSNVSVRMMLNNGSHVDFWIMYDSSGNWEFQGGIDAEGTQSFSLPLIPRRCDHFALKFTGIGQCKIFSITKTLELGSDTP